MCYHTVSQQCADRICPTVYVGSTSDPRDNDRRPNEDCMLARSVTHPECPTIYDWCDHLHSATFTPADIPNGFTHSLNVLISRYRNVLFRRKRNDGDNARPAPSSVGRCVTSDPETKSTAILFWNPVETRTGIAII